MPSRGAPHIPLPGPVPVLDLVSASLICSPAQPGQPPVLVLTSGHCSLARLICPTSSSHQWYTAYQRTSPTCLTSVYISLPPGSKIHQEWKVKTSYSGPHLLFHFLGIHPPLETPAPKTPNFKKGNLLKVWPLLHVQLHPQWQSAFLYGCIFFFDNKSDLAVNSTPSLSLSCVTRPSLASAKICYVSSMGKPWKGSWDGETSLTKTNGDASCLRCNKVSDDITGKHVSIRLSS